MKHLKFVLLFLFLAAIVITSLPAAPTPVTAQSNSEVIMLPMPDGVALSTAIYRPAGDGPFATLFIRTPYGRGDATDGNALAELGIAVVIQDARGRFDSEGIYNAFRDARADGQATLDWIVAQAWSNGRVATYGGSALGIAQYMLAPGANAGLVCQWVEVGTPNTYNAMYENGLYRAEIADNWLSETGAPHMIDQIRNHPTPDSWWDVTNITREFDTVNVAAFHIGGYYDIFVNGTIAAFLGYQNESQGAGRQHLVLGPWTHGLYTSEVGELVIPEAERAFQEELFLWLDACLLDGASGLGTVDDLDALPAVYYFTIGASEPDAPGNQWRTAETWPPADATATPLYLQPGGQLAWEVSSTDEIGTTFQYDPTNPAPTVCGPLLTLEAGACDQRSVEAREDVLVYTLPVLDAPLEVTGNLTANIWMSTDVPDTDIVVRVTDVYPDGTSLLVVDSAMRARYHASPDFTSETFLNFNEPVLLSFDLGPTSYIFNSGHQIRISITSSNVPRFAPNPNTGAMFLAEGEQGQVATTNILHDADYPSSVILPIR